MSVVIAWNRDQASEKVVVIWHRNRLSPTLQHKSERWTTWLAWASLCLRRSSKPRAWLELGAKRMQLWGLLQKENEPLVVSPSDKLDLLQGENAPLVALSLKWTVYFAAGLYAGTMRLVSTMARCPSISCLRQTFSSVLCEVPKKDLPKKDRSSCGLCVQQIEFIFLWKISLV